MITTPWSFRQGVDSFRLRRVNCNSFISHKLFLCQGHPTLRNIESLFHFSGTWNLQGCISICFLGAPDELINHHIFSFLFFPCVFLGYCTSRQFELSQKKKSHIILLPTRHFALPLYGTKNTLFIPTRYCCFFFALYFSFLLSDEFRV